MAVIFSHPMSRALLMGCLMACLPSIAISQTQKSPEILHNCGYPLNLSTPPERVITVGQASTELLYRLDLHDRVIGTSNWFTDVAKEFEGVNAKVERLADNFPSFESVISKRPDLVMADFLFAVGPQGVVGTREQFQSLGITSYVLDSECVGPSSDGSPTAFRLDSLFHSIKNLAHMFNVQAKGDELIREIRGREEAAITDAQQRNLNRLSAVFWFSSADIKMDPWVAGTTGVPAWMMSTLGIKNIVDVPEEWPSVGWESIARANPDVIVIADMTRRRFDADDYQKKLDFLRSDPVTRQMSAVVNNHIVVMDAHAMRATLRSIEGLEHLVKTLSLMNLAGK
ncbi:putative ABC-type Fe3+-hydroxamate transport system, periplasmic component [Vibrio paracholerae]|uniref:ABC transporter substrate-binding protein n=1 Tax=Vibrio paracholerae TaxID=650003 RepID=UPI000E9B0CB4|nr:ABC transporter substrate-binding protein [Vibrio paracholerae]SYZ83107.1 putative ABC-type Fe3+-hydroxamate transport system, periplasmic component [Vibrio paracholerae]